MFARPQLCPIFLSLFIFSVSFSMDNSDIESNTNQKTRIPLMSLNIEPIQSTSDNDIFSKKYKSVHKEPFFNKDVFEGVSINDLEFAFRTAAPEDALDIVEHLKDPSLLDDGTDRSRFFLGEPGTGKTTLAKAIAYKMHTEAQWNYKFINSTDIFSLGFQQSSRNQAAINLGNLLDSIIESGEPTLLIIDEVNQLLENADDPHFDTNTTSTLLWTFLDSQNYNNNFFFIGIANRLNKIPKPFKSRTILRIVRFKEITDPSIKRDLFIHKLADRSTQLHVEVDNAYIENLIKDTPGITGRDFHELALKARKLSWRENRTKKLKIVTKDHLKEAFDTYVKEKELSEYDKLEQTDEDRRHRENIDNTNRIHQENIKKQQEHFVQQLLMQIALHGDAPINIAQQLYLKTAIKYGIVAKPIVSPRMLIIGFTASTGILAEHNVIPSRLS
jgi:AAA+ superfamily predicted ATPase